MTKQNIGRPEKEFDWKVLDAILQFKPSKRDCCEIVGVSEDTIERRIREKFDMTFSEYRDLKMARTRYNLAKKQYDVAMSGNTALLIWLGKQWLGQTDKQDINNNGSITINYEDANGRDLEENQ